LILIPLYNYVIYNFSDKKPAAMQHGENSVNVQMSPTLSKSAAQNPSMPINALEPGNQRINNRSIEGFSANNHPALHHLSSSSDFVHKHVIPVFIKTVLTIIVSVVYTSEHIDVSIIS
jgi:hypothetical protein